MERFLKVLVLVAVLNMGFVVACEHGHDTTYEQEKSWVEDNCWAECSTQAQDCPDFFLCVHQDRTSEVCGFNVTRCVADACQSLPFDSCPEGYECGEDSQCHTVAPVPECVTDDDCDEGLVCENEVCVEPTPECTVDEDCNDGYVCEDNTCVEQTVEPNMVELRCCYRVSDLPDEIDLNWLAQQGYPVTVETAAYGQFSWSSPPTEDDPAPWSYAINAEIGNDGCYSALVDRSSMAGTPWTDVTVGEVPCDEQGNCFHTDPDVLWWGDRAKPLSCTMDGELMTIAQKHVWGRGWGFCL